MRRRKRSGSRRGSGVGRLGHQTPDDTQRRHASSSEVQELVSTTREVSSQPVPAAVESILEMAPLHSFSSASLSGGRSAVRAGERAARLGYASRAAECRQVAVLAGPRALREALPESVVPSAGGPPDTRQIMKAAARLTAWGP